MGLSLAKWHWKGKAGVGRRELVTGVERQEGTISV